MHHCIIDMKINLVERISKNKGYWNFNSGLLKNNEYLTKIKEITPETENDDTIE